MKKWLVSEATLILLAPQLHHGSGVAYSSGETPPSTPGAKKDIAPMPVTVDRLLILAASYQCSHSDNITYLTETAEKDVPDSSNPLLASLFLRKGTLFDLVDQDGTMRFRKECNDRETFSIDPNSQLKVYIPADN